MARPLISRLRGAASWLLSLPIHFYRGCISPWLPDSCRFTPTCSQYTLDALRQYGPLRGLAMGLRRILRCNPWGGQGYDPVPPPHIIDVHSHNTTSDPIRTLPQNLNLHAGLSVSYIRVLENRGKFREYKVLPSVGIHPWDTATLTPEQIDTAIDRLRQLAADGEIAAIGEAGIDRLRGASMQEQEAMFIRQIEISNHTGLPLIIHAVKSLDIILRLRKQLRPSAPWILHGFRAKPTQLTQLLATDTPASPLYFSLGANFNPFTAAEIPADRLLAETDESPLPLPRILRNLAVARSASPSALSLQTTLNARRLFPPAIRP